MNRMIVVAFLAGLLSSLVGGMLGYIAANTFADGPKQPIFIYDRLENSLVRTLACRCFVEPETAVLNGYAETVTSIVKSPNSRVRGGVIEVSETSLAHLDAFYDVPERFVRERVQFGVQFVWVYRATE